MPNENQLFLFVCVDDMKMVGNKDKVGPMWEILRKDIDLEEPTPAESKYVWGCTHRNAEADHPTVQAKTDLFRRITTTGVTDEKQNKHDNPLSRSPHGVVAWQHTTKSAPRGIASLLGKAYRHASRREHRTWMVIHFHPMVCSN